MNAGLIAALIASRAFKPEFWISHLLALCLMLKPKQFSSVTPACAGMTKKNAS
jgi:hypothetical protein